MIEENRPHQFKIGDLVGHSMHDHLAGIILDLEFVKYREGRQISTRLGTVTRMGSWKAWIEWNGNSKTRDYVELSYLIKLM